MKTKAIEKRLTFDELFQQFCTDQLLIDDNDSKNTISNNNNSTEIANEKRSRRKRGKHQKSFIIPTETKVMCQQMIDQNVAMQYETVMNEYWPPKSNHNN